MTETENVETEKQVEMENEDIWSSFLKRFPYLKNHRSLWLSPKGAETEDGVKTSERQIRKFLRIAMKDHPERLTRLHKPTEMEGDRYLYSQSNWRSKLYYRFVQGAIFGGDIYAKPDILRSLGMDVGERVFIAKNVLIDPFFPECVHLADDVILGMGATIVTHEINAQGNLVVGDVRIGKQTAASGCIILPGTQIGENCAVGWACVNQDVPDNKYATTFPDNEWVTKIGVFPSLGHYTITEKNTKKMLDDWKDTYKQASLGQKDQTFNFDTFYNLLAHGKHWSRRLLEYCCIIAQQSPLLAPIRNDLLRLAGAKIGKNVRIGDGVIAGLINPQNLTIEDGAVIGDGCLLSDHRVLHFPTAAEPRLRYVAGKVHIGKNAIVDQGTWVMSGIDVHDNAYVPPFQMTIRDINPIGKIVLRNPQKNTLPRSFQAEIDAITNTAVAVVSECLNLPLLLLTVWKYDRHKTERKENSLDQTINKAIQTSYQFFGSLMRSLDPWYWRKPSH